MTAIVKQKRRDQVFREGEGAHMAVQIQHEAMLRGITDLDLFIAFASVVNAHNPHVGRKCLNALFQTVTARVPKIVKVGATVIGADGKPVGRLSVHKEVPATLADAMPAGTA